MFILHEKAWQLLPMGTANEKGRKGGLQRSWNKISRRERTGFPKQDRQAIRKFYEKILATTLIFGQALLQ